MRLPITNAAGLEYPVLDDPFVGQVDSLFPGGSWNRESRRLPLSSGSRSRRDGEFPGAATHRAPCLVIEFYIDSESLRARSTGLAPLLLDLPVARRRADVARLVDRSDLEGVLAPS